MVVLNAKQDDHYVAVKPSDDIAKIFSTHNWFIIKWTYKHKNTPLEKKNITLTDANAPRTTRTRNRKPSAAAKTTQSNPNNGTASSTASSTSSRNNNSVQTNSRNNIINNPGVGRTGDRGNGLTTASSAAAVSTSNPTPANAANTTTTNGKSKSKKLSHPEAPPTKTTKNNKSSGSDGLGRMSSSNPNPTSVNTAGNTTTGESSAARSSSLSTAVSISQINVDRVKQSKKKSKSSTISTPQVISIAQAVINSRGKLPNYNAHGVDVNLLMVGVKIAFFFGDNDFQGTIRSLKDDGKLEVQVHDRPAKLKTTADKVNGFVGEENIIPEEIINVDDTGTQLQNTVSSPVSFEILTTN